MKNHLSAASACFELYPLRFRFIAREPIYLPAGESANLLRGGFGKALRRGNPDAYTRYFSPSSSQGPSGLRDLPRPFVFRVAHLDGARFAPGEPFEIGLNLFEIRERPIEIFRDALCAMLRAQFAGVEGAQILRLPLTAGPAIERVRVRFITPTELKGADHPDFGVLFARIRDRVSTLRALFGAGPLDIDFKAMGERAQSVRMIRSDLRHVDAERVSRSTGQRHPLGGFIGVAEYEGELAEFVPYLEAARWTGVGRQTVWGKGEIGWEEMTDDKNRSSVPRGTRSESERWVLNILKNNSSAAGCTSRPASRAPR
jgi:CRISPR-associated endoribonuclease Cas6